MDVLAKEIERLLTCCYAPSLARLSRCAENLCQSTIDLWVKYHSEAHEALAEVLAAGLTYDAHALELLKRFARHSDMRDSLLRCNPALLSTLMKAALADQTSFLQYTPTICAMLERTLRKELTLPAHLASWMGMLNDATAKLDAQLYLAYMESILRENAAPCFGALSVSQQFAWQTTLASYLSHTSNDFVMLALSCLASLAMQSSNAADARGLSKNTHSTLSLFQGDKGLKVLRLVFNTVSTALSTEETSRVDQIHLATNALRAVNLELLTDWLNRKEGQTLSRKVLEKLDDSLEENAIEATAEFLACIKEVECVEGLGMVATRVCEQAINHLDAANASLPLSKALSKLLIFVPAEPSITDRVLVCLLDQQQDCDLLAAECKHWLLQGLSSCSISSDHLSRHSEALAAWAASPLQDGLMAQHERTMCRTLLSMVLQGDACSMKAILARLASLPSATSVAPRRLSWAIPTISLPQPTNTPLSCNASHNWREQLHVDLQASAAHQHDILVNRMNLVCRDLESRAETTELPLRALEEALTSAKDETERLSAQLREAQAATHQRELLVVEEQKRVRSVMASMRAEAKQSAELIRQFEHKEKTGLESLHEDKRQTREANKRLTVALQTLQSEKEQTNAEIRNFTERYANQEQEIKHWKKAAEDKQYCVDKLKKASLLREKDMVELMETARKTSKDLVSQSGVLERAEAALALSRTESNVARETLVLEHKTALRQLNDEMDRLRQHAKQTEASLQAARNVQLASETELQTMQDLLGRVSAERDEKLHLIEHIKAAADEKIALLTEQHAMAIQTLQDDLKSNKERYGRVLATGEDERQRLRNALTSLKTKFDARRAEYQEAQELSKRLMAVMGGFTGGLATQKTPMRSLEQESVTTPLPDRSVVDKSVLKTKIQRSHASPVKQKSLRDLPVSPQMTNAPRPSEHIPQRSSSVAARSTLAKRKETSIEIHNASKRRESAGIYQDPQVGPQPSTMDQFLMDAEVDLDDYDETRDYTVCIQPRSHGKENAGIVQSGKKARRNDSSILTELSGLGI